jgi:hypothetical protein
MDGVATVNSATIISAREQLRGKIARGLARLRLQAAINASVVAAAISLTLLCLFIFLDRFLSLQKIGIDIWVFWGAITALSIPYVLWRAYSPKLHHSLAAVLADERLGLHSRLSSALTLDLEDPATMRFGEAFFAEAQGTLHALNVERAFPIRVPRYLALLLLPIVACLGMYLFMPYQDRLGLAAAKENKQREALVAETKARKVEGKLEDLKKKIDERTSDKAGEYKVPNQILQKAQDVNKELKDGEKNASEALVAMGKLKQEAEEKREELLKEKKFTDRLKKLKEQKIDAESDAGKGLTDALKEQDAARAAEEMEKAIAKTRQLLDDETRTADEKKKELEKFKNDLEKLANSEALKDDKALKEKLSDLADKLQETADHQNLDDKTKKELEQKGKGSTQQKNDLEKKMDDAASELDRLNKDNDAKLNPQDQQKLNDLNQVVDSLDNVMNDLSQDEQELDGDQQQQQPNKGQPTPNGQNKNKKKSSKNKQSQAMNGQKNQKGNAQNKNKQQRGERGEKQKQNGEQQQQPGEGQQPQEGGEQPGQDQQPGEGKQPGEGQQPGDGQQGGDGQSPQPGEGSGGDGKSSDPNGQPGNGLGGGPGKGTRPQGNSDVNFQHRKVKAELQNGAVTGISHFRGQGSKGASSPEFVQAVTAAEEDQRTSLELERIPADAREMVKDYFSKVKEGANIKNETPPPTPEAPKN